MKSSLLSIVYRVDNLHLCKKLLRSVHGRYHTIGQVFCHVKQADVK